jgi:trans-2,3-dihydro-3-hydroxyanthranilate isomerase
MAALAFRIVNVFARSSRLSGNPLCVVEDARGLDEATMQALARQFNLSETTFILPSEKATACVRIFTPAYEMPFAGHPTLGSAHVVRSLRSSGDALSLEMQAGIIPVTASGDRWTLEARPARWREARESAADIAAMLGLAASDVRDPRLWVNAGTEQLIVPLASRAAVERARPVAERFLGLASEDRPGKMLVFADDGDAPATVLARFFFPANGAILEDPATGSACANLGGWFQATRRGAAIRRVVAQGEAVARPSTLYLSVADGRIHVGGDVIELGRGQVAL